MCAMAFGVDKLSATMQTFVWLVIFFFVTAYASAAY